MEGEPACKRDLQLLVKNVKHVVHQFKQSLEKADDKLLEAKDRLGEEREKVNSRIRTIDETNAELQKTMKVVFDGMRRIVTETSREMAGLLKAETSSKKAAIGKEKEVIEDLLKQTQDYRQQCQKLLTNNTLDFLDLLETPLQTDVDSLLLQLSERRNKTECDLTFSLDCSNVLSEMVAKMQAAQKPLWNALKETKRVSSTVTENKTVESNVSFNSDDTVSYHEDNQPSTSDREPEQLENFSQDSGLDAETLQQVESANDESSSHDKRKATAAAGLEKHDESQMVCDSASEKSDHQYSLSQKSNLKDLSSVSVSRCETSTRALACPATFVHQQRRGWSNVIVNNVQSSSLHSVSLSSSTDNTPTKRKFTFKELPSSFGSGLLSLGVVQVQPVLQSSLVPGVNPRATNSGHVRNSVFTNGVVLSPPIRSTRPSMLSKSPATTHASVGSSRLILEPQLTESSNPESDEDELPLESHYDNCGFCGNSIGDDSVQCAVCPLVFHMRCVDRTSPPEGKWKCQVCTASQTGSTSEAVFKGAEEPFNPLLQILLDHPNGIPLRGSEPKRHNKDRAVKKPSDLTAVKQKLMLGKYSTDRRQFITDIRHIFLNCGRIHKPWTIEAAMGRRMSMLFEELLSRHLEVFDHQMGSDAKRSRKE